MKKKILKRGFTIVELVIVIAVIAILAAILIPTFTSVVNNANEAAIQAELKNAKTQYIMEASDDKNYNPDLELVFAHTNDKGDVLYYLEEDGTYVLATGENFEDNKPKTDVVFVPLQYKSGTDEWLFAEFGEGTVGVIAYNGGPAVESYGDYVSFKETDPIVNPYKNTIEPIWKATDNGFELSGELTGKGTPGGLFGNDGSTDYYFITFSIEKPENVVLNVNSTITVIGELNRQFGGGSTILPLLQTEFNSNGTFDHIQRIKPGATTFRIIIDWDGSEGDLFTPKTYIIDVSKLTFTPH